VSEPDTRCRQTGVDPLVERTLDQLSAVDFRGRTIWIADTRREGKRFVLRADEKLTAFLELKPAVCKNRIDIAVKGGTVRSR
jgi:hypothetical protein